jgi:hypothetical protein
VALTHNEHRCRCSRQGLADSRAVVVRTAKTSIMPGSHRQAQWKHHSGKSAVFLGFVVIRPAIASGVYQEKLMSAEIPLAFLSTLLVGPMNRPS